MLKKMVPSLITDQLIYSEDEALEHARIHKVLPEGVQHFCCCFSLFIRGKRI